ncbi:MAG: alpha/beta fold hydrolase [Bacteroidota bacterium]
MRKLRICILAVLIASSALGQDITGQWNSLLTVQGMQLRLVFHITKTDQGYSSTMDSPDQGAAGIPMTSTVFENPKLIMKMTNAGIEYEGELKDGQITGTFKQQGMSVPLDLKREVIEKPVVNRPQEPKKPYPYYSEEVTFENKQAGVNLAGTLTLPAKEGKYPVVILITGSGPQNRDEELVGHKPFLVLADYLTRNGIAVLRYDDRGTAQSTGDFSKATSADLASDVEAAIAYLKIRKDIDKKKIGLMGHSEGGIIAPMVASKSKDVRFIVLLAGTGIPGGQLLLLQEELIGKAMGMSDNVLLKTREINKECFDMVAKSISSDQLKADLTEYLKKRITDFPADQKPAGMSDDDLLKMLVNQIANPWMQFFIKYDPVPALQKVKCPVLALNGGKDLQVPPGENLAAIGKALEKGRNKKVTIKELPGLNHLFQECTIGSPDEYALIEQTFSPIALEVVAKWIQGIVN